MANKTKVGFGAVSAVDQAISDGKLDAFDLLCMKDENDVARIGWIDKNGEKVLVPTGEETDLSEIEAEVAKKANDKEVEASYEKISYTIGSTPVGTLVDYRDKEIRIMAPSNTVWIKQNVGAEGNANSYYLSLRAYAPDGCASFKEDLKTTIEDDTMYYFEDNNFAGTDEFGRKYSVVWLPMANYDADSDTWTYFGINSSEEKYIGWYYSVEWYNEDGVVIASDKIRINLTNENCHGAIEPSYVATVIEQMKKYCDEAVVNASGIQVVEF